MSDRIYTCICPNGHRWISASPFSSGLHLGRIASEPCKQCGQSPKEIEQSNRGLDNREAEDAGEVLVPGCAWHPDSRSRRVYGQWTPTPTTRMDIWVEVPGEADCNVDDMDGEWVGPLEPPE